MKYSFVIMKKELSSYFNSAIAYIFFTLFLVIVSFLFFRLYFLIGIVSMNDFFSIIPWIFLIFIPSVTMKSWAEEKKSGTMEVLLTMPVRDVELVAGKFLAGFVFVLIAILLTLSVPILVSMTGDLDWGPVLTSYIGLAFLAGSYVAIGNLVSSFTSNQVSAFLVTTVAVLIMMLIGTEPVYSIFPGSAGDIIRNLSLSYHFQSIQRGVLDSRDVVYYLSIIFLFIFYNIRSIESRNW
ncbi:MAG TPA: ABC transporter permease subunit [bacterium]|nr:ABC transporter permease subunit [bacterium]HPS29159.1 ABC transporter permease subunit [bacterium]